MTDLEQIFFAEYGETKNLSRALHAVATAVRAQEGVGNADRKRQPARTRVVVKHRTHVIRLPSLDDMRRHRCFLKKRQIGVIVDSAASEFGITPRDLFAKRFSSRDALHASWIAAYVMREFQASYPAIALVLKMRDHTYPLYGIGRLRKDQALAARAKKVLAVVRAHRLFAGDRAMEAA